MHDIQKTSTFLREYQKLKLRYRRMVDEAMDVLKETPTDYQSRITKISKHKDGIMYRYRLPGMYLMYVVPPFETGESKVVTILDIKSLLSPH
jgi:mRNA-degrading endonuclease RelE of RelBE toxin-antitoxin system